jgi:RNA polymerase sigma-70 factor (ECF subfamily)
MSEKQKKNSSFDDLVKPYAQSLQNTARRLTKDAFEAEDLYQETLYRAYRFFDKYQQNTNFRAWIFKIMTNSYISSYRKSARQPARINFDDIENFSLYHNYQDESRQYQSTAYSLSGDMFEDEIKEALEKIPYYFRLVVLLSDIEGFSYKEIADMVKTPLGTVMSRLHRGRSLLRNKLKNYARDKGYVFESN